MTQHTDMVKKDEQIANLTAVMKTCVCGQKPAPLFAFSSQVDYPTAYTYPAAYQRRALIPMSGYALSSITFDVIDISSRISTDDKYAGGVLAPNGHIYMVPHKADSIGDFDPSTNAFDVIDISSRISTGKKYIGGVLAPNGHIYMVPFMADSIGDFDFSTNVFHVIDISSRISTDNKYAGLGKHARID